MLSDFGEEPLAVLGHLGLSDALDREHGVTVGRLLSGHLPQRFVAEHDVGGEAALGRDALAQGAQWGLETAIRGASERLSPILMTALVTALGLLPMALGSGAPGREIEGPMALVILGGLATSTVLNLLVLPTLSLRFFHKAGN